MKKFLNFLSTLMLILLMVLTVWILYQRLQGQGADIAGFRLYQVVTGSMEPEYHVGDVILVHKTPVESLHIGDDIAYLSEQGQTAGLTVTHRLVEEPFEDENNIWHLQTEGIAPGATRDPEIEGRQVLGKVIYRSKVLTAVYKLFVTKIGLLVFILPLCFMMVAEMVNFVSLMKKGDTEDG